MTKLEMDALRVLIDGGMKLGEIREYVRMGRIKNRCEKYFSDLEEGKTPESIQISCEVDDEPDFLKQKKKAFESKVKK